MHKLFSTLTAIVLLCAFSITAFAAPTEEEIKVGFFLMPGYNELSEDGSYSGYSFDYLQEISKYTGWKYHFIYCSWPQCLEMLRKGEIDLAGPALYSDERAKTYAFPDLSCGTSYIKVTARADNAAYTYGDYSEMNGSTAGMLNGSNVINKFNEFCAENKISAKVKLYDDAALLQAALQNREIDICVTSSIRKLQDEKILATFAPEPLYFMTSKGNKEILAGLNSAQEQIKIIDPYFDQKLYQKYNETDSGEGVPLTKEEQNYISGKKNIIAACDPDCPPLSQLDPKTKEYRGIIPDIFSQISAQTGLEFTYIAAAGDQAIDAVRTGKADIVCGFPNDYVWAKNNDITTTLPYLTLDLSLVRSLHKKDGIENIAVRNNDYIAQTYVKKYFTAKLLAFSTYEECIAAVNSGKADMTVVPAVVAEQIRKNPRFNRVYSSLAPNADVSEAIGLSIPADPLLFSILNKSVSNLQKAKIDEIVYNNTDFSGEQVTLTTLLYRNPVLFVILLSSFFALLLFFIFLRHRTKRRYDFQLRTIYFIDNLTGIWNLEKFKMEATHILDTSAKRYYLCSMDISKFKFINDSYGNNVGNTVLRQLGERLIQTMDQDSIVARSSADNFVMMRPFENLADIHKQLFELQQQIDVFNGDNFNIKLAFNFGVYIISDAAADITYALDRADIARKSIKGGLKTNMAYFDNDMEVKLMLEKEIAESMDMALQNGEFKVFYQPKYDILSDCIVGAEALVRWHSPSKGYLRSELFIPIFEENGFITDLDFYVLEQVMKLQRRRIDEEKEPIRISVNQSRRNLKSQAYLPRLRGLLAKYCVPAELIELELTERSFVDDTEIIQVLREIKRLGMAISMDDFGTGYSSLSLLRKMPIDVLKIDKSFFGEDKNSAKARIILKDVIRMAKDLDITIICEGVETLDQAEFLKSIGCRFVQGFLYYEPMDEVMFLSIYDETKRLNLV